MKRCPQCDFIYEDDEALCPMDGASLGHLTGPLTSQETVSPRTAATSNSHGRGLTLVVGGLVLAAALLLFYHNGLKRMLFPANPQQSERYNFNPASGDRTTSGAPAQNASPADMSDTDPFRQPSSITQPDAKSEVPKRAPRVGQADDPDPFGNSDRPINGSAPTPLPTASPRLPQPRANTGTVSPDPVFVPPKPNVTSSQTRPSPATKLQTKSSNTNQQESKVKSFFKKTGRVLKKPFEQ